MTGERVQRRLAAILAADVVGYSALMERAEEATYAEIGRLRREVIDPCFGRHQGRLIKTTGDGILAEFASPLAAVKCGLEIQDHLASNQSPLQLRIGINLGDVIVDEQGDVFGDGINVAARLESVANPGGILISGKVHSEVEGKLDVGFEDRGEQQLKNISKAVRAYAVCEGAHRAPTGRLSTAPPLPDKPSIAVLPFQNMSGDPEQEFFADGIAEDVLTTLSKLQELLVIARNSSFVFKGQAKDVREVGRILGARYVLEGSVRKAGNRVRLAAQLIDSLNGSHVWADRFEGDLNDVFELQDRITQDIVVALEVRLTLGEQARVWRKRSGSPLVYEHFLKGRSLYVNFARHTHAQARSDLEQALEINPNFTPALVCLGWTLTDQARFGWEKDQAATYDAALECAARALGADPGCGEAYTVVGYVRTYQRRHEEALEAGEKAVALCPSGTDAYHMTAMSYGYAGDFERAILYEEQAQRLSPIELSVSMVDEARARFHLNDLTAARDIARRVLQAKPRWLTAQTTLTASLWNLAEYDDARAIARSILAGHPHFSVRRWGRGLPYRYDEHLDALLAPLRLAGLPD
ncbi:adenylate/guanylate cyclase domain-containing protein [Bradyrhizobium sp. ORS 111]|uniref:adenylate/guanylate cyclase domain-containing protein n=1 Tax=Bradyrhizobium sp. ORS 111 TaxID=1685958 RepID=UPI00388FE8CB